MVASVNDAGTASVAPLDTETRPATFQPGSAALPEIATKFDKDAVTVIEPFDIAGWAKAIRRVTALKPLGTVAKAKAFPKDWREFGRKYL
jgi:hypothetical protein